MPVPGPVCPHCNVPSKLVDAGDVYGPKFAGQFAIWACVNYPDCDTYVGVHKNSTTAQPLGSLANAPLRKLRKETHAAFDELWKSKGMSRAKAYRKLESIMGTEKGKAHIAWFSEEECRKALMALIEPTETTY